MKEDSGGAKKCALARGNYTPQRGRGHLQRWDTPTILRFLVPSGLSQPLHVARWPAAFATQLFNLSQGEKMTSPNSMPRQPNGPRPTQNRTPRTKQEAEQQLRTLWRDAPHRLGLLKFAVWIATRISELETARAVDLARKKLVAKSAGLTATWGTSTIVTTELRVVEHAAGRAAPMVLDLISGEWRPDEAPKQGLHPARYTHAFQSVAADVGGVLEELCAQHGSREAAGVDIVGDEPVPRIDAWAVRVSSAIHTFCTDALKQESGRGASSLELFAHLMVLCGLGLALPLTSARELMLLAMASGVEQGGRERPFSDASHADRWRLLLRKARGHLINFATPPVATIQGQGAGPVGKHQLISNLEIAGKAPLTESKIMSRKTITKSKLSTQGSRRGNH